MNEETEFFKSQFACLRGAKIARIRVGETTLDIVFDNGAILTVRSEASIDNYEYLNHYMSVIVEPPPAEDGGWIVL